MRCPTCNRIIGDTYDAINMHYAKKHPQSPGLAKRPDLYDEAERLRMEQAAAVITKRLRKKNKRRFHGGKDVA